MEHLERAVVNNPPPGSEDVIVDDNFLDRLTDRLEETQRQVDAQVFRALEVIQEEESEDNPPAHVNPESIALGDDEFSDVASELEDTVVDHSQRGEKRKGEEPPTEGANVRAEPKIIDLTNPEPLIHLESGCSTLSSPPSSPRPPSPPPAESPVPPGRGKSIKTLKGHYLKMKQRHWRRVRYWQDKGTRAPYELSNPHSDGDDYEDEDNIEEEIVESPLKRARQSPPKEDSISPSSAPRRRRQVIIVVDEGEDEDEDRDEDEDEDEEETDDERDESWTPNKKESRRQARLDKLSRLARTNSKVTEATVQLRRRRARQIGAQILLKPEQPSNIVDFPFDPKKLRRRALERYKFDKVVERDARRLRKLRKQRVANKPQRKPEEKAALRALRHRYWGFPEGHAALNIPAVDETDVYFDTTDWDSDYGSQRENGGRHRAFRLQHGLFDGDLETAANREKERARRWRASQALQEKGLIDNLQIFDALPALSVSLIRCEHR